MTGLLKIHANFDVSVSDVISEPTGSWWPCAVAAAATAAAAAPFRTTDAFALASVGSVRAQAKPASSHQRSVSAVASAHSTRPSDLSSPEPNGPNMRRLAHGQTKAFPLSVYTDRTPEVTPQHC